MKVYPNLDVELTYHNFGSAWLMILRGSTEQIELTFNGLFNLGATNGDREYQDHLETVATFWSDEDSMFEFFFNQFFHPRCSLRIKDEQKDPAYQPAMTYAAAQMEKLRTTGHEFFLDFANRFVPETYSTGQVTAERPDNDMKDAILTNAYKDKNESEQTDVCKGKCKAE